MQTILTQCPRCQTSFKVSDKQLAIASGMVRCGSCLDVFSAPANRITIKQPVADTPPPENFSDDHEEENIFAEQTRPAVSPSTQENTNYPDPAASRFMESAPVASSADSTIPPSADVSADSAGNNSVTVAAGSADDLEFILDDEDDVAFGDMVLDAAQQGGMAAGARDSAIHDAGNFAEQNTYAEPGSASAGISHKESADTASELIDEKSYVPASASASDSAQFAYDHEEYFAPAGPDASKLDEIFPEVDGLALQETVSELMDTAESYQNPEHLPQASKEPEQIEEITAFVAQEFPPEDDERLHSATDFKRTSVVEVNDALRLDDDFADGAEANAETAAFDHAARDEQVIAAEITDIRADVIAAEAEQISAHEPAAGYEDHDGPASDTSLADGDLRDPDDILSSGFSAGISDDIEGVAPSGSTSSAERDKAELREYLAELEDTDALEPLASTSMDSIAEDPLTFEVRDVFRKHAATFGWLALCLGLLAMLMLQVVANNLEFMRRSPSYSSYLPMFCVVLDCPVPETAAATQSMRSQELLVRSHPSIPDALEVSFIFSNEAGIPQEFPLVELRFMDSNRRLMANRLFRPAEYLPPELAVLDEMPAGSSVQVMLEMADPGSDAVIYEITFRDPLTEAPVGSTSPATTP